MAFGNRCIVGSKDAVLVDLSHSRQSDRRPCAKRGDELLERPRENLRVRVEEQDPFRVDDFEPAVVRGRESAILRREHSNVRKLAPDEIDCVVSRTAVDDDDIQVEIP